MRKKETMFSVLMHFINQLNQQNKFKIQIWKYINNISNNNSQ